MITLAFCLMVVAVARAAPIRFDILPLSYVGTATPIPYGVRLTDTTDPQVNDINSAPPAGAIWTQNMVPVASGFSVSFWFRLSEGTGIADPGGGDPGADGFAFVVQNGGWDLSGSGNQAIGVGAGGMGYMYLSNSLVVEFDTWKNGPYGDLDGNHIAVNTRGTSFNVPHHSYDDLIRDLGVSSLPYTADPVLFYQEVDRPLNDGQIQSARIDYIPGAMSMYLNSGLLFSIPVSLDSLLNLDAGNAYVGFTAGTRYGYENHDILFEPVPEPATWLMLSTGLAVMSMARYFRRKRNGCEQRAKSSCGYF